MASPPVLVDTGPLVAWFDRGDGAYARCRGFFAATRRPLVTTWPVLTEVCHLVPAHVVIPFMGFVAQGGIAVDRMDAGAAVDIAAMMAKYADVPMDLADASLVWRARSAPRRSQRWTVLISASTGCRAASGSRTFWPDRTRPRSVGGPG